MSLRITAAVYDREPKINKPRQPANKALGTRFSKEWVHTYKSQEITSYFVATQIYHSIYCYYIITQLLVLSFHNTPFTRTRLLTITNRARMVSVFSLNKPNKPKKYLLLHFKRINIK